MKIAFSFLPIRVDVEKYWIWGYLKEYMSQKHFCDLNI